MSSSQTPPWEPQDPSASDDPAEPQHEAWQPYPAPADGPAGPPEASQTGPAWPAQQPHWGPPGGDAYTSSAWQGGQWQVNPGEEKPPVIPFRPLTLGDLFEGTFAAIRSNPKVMFTISVSVMLLVGLIAAIVNGVVFTAWGTWDIIASDGPDPDDLTIFADYEGLYQSSLAQLGLSIFQSLAMLLVTGMLVLSVTNAVVAKRLNLRMTWETLRLRFVRLVLTAMLVWVIMVGLILVSVAVAALPFFLAFEFQSLSVLMVFVGIVLFIAVTPLMIWVGLRLSFSNMIVVVEDTGVTAAVRRSWNLTRGAAWRLLGRYLLLAILMGIVMSLLGGAITVFAAVITGFAPVWVGAFVTTLLLAVLAGFAQPVSASYNALMYVDERIRSENLAPVLEEALAENRQKQTEMPGADF